MTYKRANLTLNNAKEIVASRLEFTENKAYPLLVDDTGLIGMEKAARDYFSSKEGTYKVKAGALYAKSLFAATLANFFLKVTNPPIPAKMFTDKEKAVEWLQQFK